MTTREFAKITLAAMAAALLLAGCDESDPVAPPDSTIILSASPTNLPAGGGESSLTAVVIDANGVPQDGVAVFFSTNAGALASQGIAQVTDGDGRARDTLTTTDSAQVTAQSGDATAQVTVTVAGAQLVGAISLSCQPTSGNAPLSTDCSALVTSTTGNKLAGVTLSVNIPLDSNAIKAPPFPVTDTNGLASFGIENMTIDNAVITASSGSVTSNSITIDITVPGQ